MMKLIALFGLVIFFSCNNSNNTHAPSVESASSEIIYLKVIGFSKVMSVVKDGAFFVSFEPSIPRDDMAMSYAFLEIGEQLFNLNKKPLPKQDIVDVSGGKAIRYTYPSNALLFLPMKNDDGTIHTVMVMKN